MDYLKIKHVNGERLGKGAQGTVGVVTINGERFACKKQQSQDNIKLAKKKMKTLYTEYIIGVNLVHPNIVSYKYFMSEFKKKEKTHFFNLIMELIDG